MARVVPVITTAVLTILLVGDTSITAKTRATIRLVNNGYEGLLVAIAETVPAAESSTVTDRVKSWGDSQAYEAAKGQTFNTANVLVDDPKPKTMTTRTHAGCGAPGEFIQIPTEYVTGKLTDVFRKYGYPGSTIVHEWGHLRWGLRDEYQVPGYPRFYRDSDYEVAAVKCGKYMNGKNVDFETGKACTLDPNTGLPTATCHFKADRNNPGVKASLMFQHNVTELFCDNDVSDPDTLHNDEAPNEQNALCDGKSAWEVMREHSDFKDGNNPPIDRSQVTVPIFRIVQAKAQRVVLVLDISGSMNNFTSGSTRIKRLRQAAADYLLRAVPSGYSVGIVSFSKQASVRKHLTTITSRSDREALIKALPKYASGSTAIGAGLRRGVEVLKEGGDSASGGILILVSDGKETERPVIADVKPSLVAAGVIVHTILISDIADPQLIDLAADTKGRSFFYSGSNDTTDMVSAFWSTITDKSDGTPGLVPVEMFLETVLVPANDKVVKSVAVDSSVGRDTEFTFSYSKDTFPLDVLVTSPSGQNFTTNSVNSRVSLAAKQLMISFTNDTEVGRWTILLINHGSSVVNTQLLVSSRAPTDDSYPIRTRTFLSQNQIDFKGPRSSLKLIVGAEVMKGYEPITGAKVEVQVGSTPWKSLNDDGLGVDVSPDDGIYSAALLRFPANGKFPVKVRVAAEEGTTKLLVGGGSRAYTVDGGLAPTYETVDQFQRRADVGLVSVSNLTPDTDLRALYPFPPAKVKDLRVVNISFVDNSMTLQWTAVGDYEEQETAFSYDLRFSSNIRDLRNSFPNASPVDDIDVIAGSLSSPGTPSEREIVVIRFPAGHENQTLFFGVKVHHGVDRISAVSNIVSAAVIFVPPAAVEPTTGIPSADPPTTRISDSTEVPTTTTNAETTATSISDSATIPTTKVEPNTGSLGLSGSTLLAIEISAAVIVIFVIALVVAIAVRRSRSSRSQRSTSGDDYEMPSARKSTCGHDYETLQL